MHFEENGHLRRHNILAVILAGGKGTRLEPLTRDRAKPAVPFGGLYRIIDFTLSNCLNSGLRKVLVLTQYKAMSLDRHLSLGWKRLMSRELGEFVDVVPPQQRIDEHWYQGTADAVYQNIYTLEKERPDYVVILAGDHIYKMNYMTMVDVASRSRGRPDRRRLRVPKEEARHFGVMQVDSDERVIDFVENEPNAETIPGDPQHALASMGIYVFNARFLFEQLCFDATQPGSQHDFGRNIIPSVIDDAPRLRLPLPRRKQKARCLLARCRHAGRLLRSQHGPDLGRSAIEHVRHALAHPHLSAELSAAEIRVRRRRSRRPPRRSDRQRRLLRHRSFPAATCGGRSSGPTCASTATPTSKIQFCSKESMSAGTPTFAARSSTSEFRFRLAR